MFCWTIILLQKSHNFHKHNVQQVLVGDLKTVEEV